MNTGSRRAAIDETFGTLRKVMAQLHGCIRTAFAKEGMSIGQMVLLRVLIHRGKMTARELANAMSVTTGNITGLVDKLEAAGLVTRLRSTEDRRVVHLELTTKARERFKKVDRTSIDMLAEAFDGWKLSEIKDLQRLLGKLTVGPRRPLELTRVVARRRAGRAPSPTS